MFCDIRDFTRLTEVLTPYERQAFLNQYFTMMTHPIVKNGGDVDKIMGDCVMGIFPDGAAAVQAAIDMRLELQRFNEGMYRAGSPKIPKRHRHRQRRGHAGQFRILREAR